MLSNSYPKFLLGEPTMVCFREADNIFYCCVIKNFFFMIFYILWPNIYRRIPLLIVPNFGLYGLNIFFFQYTLKTRYDI